MPGPERGDASDADAESIGFPLAPGWTSAYCTIPQESTKRKRSKKKNNYCY